MPPRPKVPAADTPSPPGWEPFLAAINANLDDDTPRLVFADWLQENGDEARAEFIRIQCELWRAHPGYSGNYGLIRDSFTGAQRDAWKREQDLENSNRVRWVGAFPNWSDHHSFRRGFVYTLNATGRQWLRDGERVRSLTPLENLGLYRTAGAEALFRAPALTGLRRLFVSDLTSTGAQALADAPALDTLEGLSLHDCFESPLTLRGAVGALARSERLGKLARVWVRSAPIGDAIAHGLAQNAHVRNLIEVELFKCGLGAAWLEQLLSAPCATGLRVLNLQANNFGDAGVRALVRSPLAALEELNLRYNTLTAESARLLAAWSGLASVRTLRLDGNRFDEDSVRELLASEYLANVRWLELPALGIRKPARDRLMALPSCRRIAQVTFC